MDHVLSQSEREVVAVGDYCKLERCGCGVFHLTIGPMTMKLSREIVGDLALALAAFASRTVTDVLGLRVRRGDA